MKLGFFVTVYMFVYYTVMYLYHRVHKIDLGNTQTVDRKEETAGKGAVEMKVNKVNAELGELELGGTPQRSTGERRTRFSTLARAPARWR